MINTLIEVPRLWGHYITRIHNKVCAVKDLFIDSGKSISYQKHLNRSEKWLIISGSGIINIDGLESEALPGMVFDIPQNSFHKITANTDMRISEWWIGDSSEDDIVRI